MTIDLSPLDAVAQAELVARGEATPLELVDAAIARIEAAEPRVHALASTDFEGARARARAAAGPTGPFAGVPFLAKDLLPVPGLPCTFGSRLFRDHVPTEGSPYTEALESAGLVLLGKTTTSELGLLGSTETTLHGTTRNPWDLERSATGSSGGSAAAVAAGMVPMAHASDGGGSIRIPASACGLFGFKPGRGRCLPALPPAPVELVIEHVVSRTVRDSAYLLAHLERPDVHPRVGRVTGPDPRRLRIATYRTTLVGQEPEPAVGATLDAAIALCRSLGHEVVEVPPPDVDGPAISDAFFTFAGASVQMVAGAATAQLGRTPGPDELEPFTLALAEWFATLPAGALEEAVATMNAAGATMDALVAPYDAVLTPTLPRCVPRLGELAPDLPRETLIRRTERLAGYTPIHTFAGIPAMSVPLGQDPDGLPIGMHFASKHGDERTLLALAYELEEAAPWIDRLLALS